MADKYEERISKFLDQKKITEEEAKKATSFSEIVEKATKGTIKSANPKYDLAGTSSPYRTGLNAPGKYNYISDDVANQIINGTRTSTSHNIWRQVNSPNWLGGNVQYAVDQLMGLKHGDTLLGLDVETLGTGKFQGGTGNFGITQIAAVPYSVDFNNPDGPLVRMPGEPINVLTKPDKPTMDWLRTTLQKLRDSKGVVPNLTAEEYRSLKDLIAYAGDAQFGDAAGVILKTNSMALSDGTNLKKYIGLIEKGLDNLEHKALSVTQAMDTLNQKMFHGGYRIEENFKYFTFNGLAFDLPALNEATGGKLPLGQGHIDLYEASKQAYGDLYSAFYRDRNTRSVRALGRLENVFEATFGMNMQQAGLKAHYGVDDTIGMGMVANKRLPEILSRIRGGARRGGHDIMGRYGKRMSSSVEYQMDALQNGTTLFSRGSAFKGSDLDAVIDNGKVRGVGPAIYKNRTYTLVDQFMQDGHYSVLLHNMEDDIYHVVGRKSKEELQSLMQRSFVPYSKDMPGYARMRAYSVYDAARREYESMFTGDGAYNKATKYMGAINKMQSKAGGKPLYKMTQKEFDALLSGNDFGLTNTQTRHMRQFYKRVSAESGTIRGFLGEIDKAGLNMDQKNIAMGNFKETLDAQLGFPTRDLKLPSRMNQVELFAPGPKGGVRRGIDATRFDTLESGIRSIITGGVKDSSMNFSNVVDNFDQVVSDLVGQGVLGMDEGKKLIYDSSRFLSNMGDKTSGAMYLSQLLANNIGNRLERVNAIQGVADLRATSHIVNKLGNAGPLFAGVIDSAKNLITYSNKGIALTDEAKQFINASHTDKVMRMQQALNLPGTKMPRPITEELEAFAKSLADQGVYMNAYIDRKNSRGLQLAIYSKEYATDVMRKGLKSQHIAKAYIPLAENDMLISGGVNKANIMYAVMGKGGDTWVSTSQHQALFKLRYSADRVIDAMKVGNLDAASRVMSKSVYRALNPLSSMSRYADVADELDFSSKAANWLRTSYVNISPLVDEILKKDKMSFEGLTLDQSNDLITDILHGSSGKYRTKHGAEIQKALGGLNLNLGVASVKTELMNRGIFATADARWLVPFGTYSPATRESIRQAQNYYRLSAKDVDASRINPIIMTDIATDVYGGEITGLTVKTARMNDTAIKQLIGDQWGNLALGAQPSTFDQMGLMKESVARQFGTFKRKKVYIDPGMGLEVNPAILRQLETNGFLPFEKGITIGQVIKDNNGMPISEAARPVLYDSKYGSIIRGVNMEAGRYAVDVDEFVPSMRGTKFITESGIKFTQRIIPDAAWNRAFKGFEDVDAIIGGEILGSNKQPATVHMLAELKYAVDEYLYKNVTMGKLERAKAEANVVNVMGDMLGSTRGIRFENYDMDGGPQRLLVIPGQSRFKDTTWTDVHNAVRNGLGVNTTRMIGGYNANVGLTTLRKAMVEEYPDFVGARRYGSNAFEGINWGMRELEMIRTRYMRYGLSGGPNVSALYENIKGNMLHLTADNIRENRGIFGIIQQTMMGKLEGDYASLGLSDIDNLKALPFKESGNVLGDFSGTILDSSLAAGKAGVMVDLPETFMVGRGAINQIYMPNFRLDNKMDGNIVRPNRLQNQQLGIIEAIQGYRAGISSGDRTLAENSHSRIQNLINEYVVEAGQEGMGSRGSVAKSTLGGPLKHSGRTIASGYGIADYFDAAGNVIHDQVVKREGHIGISEKGMRSMLSGVGEADLRRIIELSGGDLSSIASGRGNAMDALVRIVGDPSGPGLPGLIGRNPTIGQGSVLAVKYHVDPLASRNSMLTVGVATALRADHDGDYVSHLLPWVGGKKAKALNEAAFVDTISMFNADIGMLQDIGEHTLKGLGADMRSNKQTLGLEQIAEGARAGGVDDSIISHFDNPVTQMLETQSRLLKSVGQYSNLSYALRKSAETLRDSGANLTVGKYQIYEIIGALGEQMEQQPISAKKLEELLAKSGVGVEERSDKLQKYVEAQRRLRTSDIYNFDIDKVIDDAKAVGILTGEGGITGHYGVMLKSKLQDMDVGEKEVRAALTDIKAAFSENGLYDPALRLFSSAPTAPEEVFRMYGAVMDPDKVIPSPGIKLLHDALGASFDEAQAARNLGSRILKNTAGGAANEIPVSEVIGAAQETVGKNAADNVMSSTAKMFGNIKLGGAGAIALGALGAWALSGAVRGPNTEHEPVEAQADQAPSADGTYVNPMAYAAGAPAGAGPSAYVSPRGTGYERINVKINGNVNRGMTNDEVAQLVSDEIRRQSGVDINLKITSEDNRQTIDKQWLQTQFANALTTGYVY